MFKHIISAALLVAATTSFASAKDTLYIVNSGSSGGSYNAQLQAWMTDLDQHYDVNFIHAKGCAKASAVLQKITSNPENQAISIYSATWDHSSKACEFLYPKDDTFLFSQEKSGVVFTMKGNNPDFLRDGVTFAINGTNDKWVQDLATANGVSMKTVRYKNSKGVTLGLMNGEADYAVINSGSQFWKNQEKLDGLAMLGPKAWGEMQSVSTFNGRTKLGFDNYLQFGPGRDKLLQTMRTIFDDDDSNIRKWTDANQAWWSNIDGDNPQQQLNAFRAAFPQG